MGTPLRRVKEWMERRPLRREVLVKEREDRILNNLPTNEREAHVHEWVEKNRERRMAEGHWQMAEWHYWQASEHRRALDTQDLVRDEDSGEWDSVPEYAPSKEEIESASKAENAARAEAAALRRNFKTASDELRAIGHRVLAHGARSFWDSLNRYSLAVGGLTIAAIGFLDSVVDVAGQEAAMRWAISGIVAAALFHAPRLLTEAKDWLVVSTRGYRDGEISLRSWTRWLQLSAFIAQTMIFSQILYVIWP